MRDDLIVGLVWGLGGFALVLFALKVRAQAKLRSDLGGAYDFLAQLQPRISEPVIRVAPPTLRL